MIPRLEARISLRDLQFFRQVCVFGFLFSGVPQASAGVGHAFAFAVQALVTLGGALL